MNEHLDNRGTVHVVQGLCRPLGFTMGRDRIFALHVAKWDRAAEEVVVCEHKFEGPAHLRRWLKVGKAVLPRSFLDDLERHYRGALDLCGDAGKRTWDVTLDDVLAAPGRWFDIEWRLSGDSPELENGCACDSLTEAMACLADTGAMQARPGNSGSIQIGSVLLYATWFTSEGIDQGDSHVNPRTHDRANDLFSQILAFEKEHGFEHEAELAEAC